MKTAIMTKLYSMNKDYIDILRRIWMRLARLERAAKNGSSISSAITFTVPDYENYETILVGNGTVLAPSDGWIRRHSKSTNTTYFWAQIMINNAAVPVYKVNYGALAPNVEYEFTSPFIAVRQGMAINSLMGVDGNGTININEVLFHRIQ